MKHRQADTIVVAMAAMAFVTTTFAADPSAVLGRFDGKVLIGQNESTVPAQKGMKLVEGTRVFTSDGAWVEIVYADGCVINLPQQSMITVKGPGQCTTAKEAISKTGGFIGKPIGQVPAAGLLTIGGFQVTSTFAALAAVGGAAAIAGVTVAVTNQSSSSDNQNQEALLIEIARKNEAQRTAQEQQQLNTFLQCAAASPPC